MWVDGGFSKADFRHWLIDTFRWILAVVLRPEGLPGFVLLPKRTYGGAHLRLAAIGAVV
jgi:hypothetical protein